MSRKPLDLTNRRFGRLVCLMPTPIRIGTSVAWLCHCDCGRRVELAADDMTRQAAPKRSCGCIPPIRHRGPQTERTLAILTDLAAGLSPAQVARKHAVSRQRVSQIRDRAAETISN